MIGKNLTFYKHKVGYYVLALFSKISATFCLDWKSGRQGGSYMKFLILSSERFKFDMYLLKYPTGSYISDHKDPVQEGFEHHRVNVVLNKNFKGGKFVIMGKSQEGRIHKFRPDKFKHKVTLVKEGTRYVFSIGWLKKAA